MYMAKDWDAKDTMQELGRLSKERREEARAQKVEEENQRRKLAAEKKEEQKKQKATEKEMESIVRNAMKVKLKAKQDVWKGQSSPSRVISNSSFCIQPCTVCIVRVCQVPYST